MSQPVEKKLTPIGTKSELYQEFGVVAGAPRRVKQATLQAETLWPGKIGAEINLSQKNCPHIKMLWIPGDGLVLQWTDGSIYTVPPANIKGMEHE